MVFRKPWSRDLHLEPGSGALGGCVRACGESGAPAVGIRSGGARAEAWPLRRRAVGGGPSGFLLPFRLLGSGASWGEITSSAACPPPPQLPLSMAPFSLPRAPCCGRGGGRGSAKERGGLALGVSTASLAESDPLGISPSLSLGSVAGGVQPGGIFSCCCTWERVSQVAPVVKNPPASAGDKRLRVRSLGRKDPLEEGMATHSSILAWRIPWTGEPDGLQSMGRKSQTRLKQQHARTCGKLLLCETSKDGSKGGTWKAGVLKSHDLLSSLLGASCWPCPAPCPSTLVPWPAGVPGDGICYLSQITLPGISNRP